MKTIISTLLVAVFLSACGGGTDTQAAPVKPATLQKYALWGDSLTAGGYASNLQSLIPSHEIYMGGVGGQTSTQIAARQGSFPISLSVTGGVIPASGAVTIATRSVDPITNQGGGPITGTLAGVKGVLTREPDNSYTFNRSTPGVNTAANSQSTFTVDTAGREYWVSVLWLGRNNSNDGVQIKADIAGAVAFLKSSPKKYVVLSILNMDVEPSGSGAHSTITQLNGELAALYPDNYIDIRAYLISKYDPTSPQDVLDHTNDVVPTSLRKDGIHLNAAGNAVVAQRVADFFAAKNWL